jgi:DNA-binding NarL/FixJ family response regulator
MVPTARVLVLHESRVVAHALATVLGAEPGVVVIGTRRLGATTVLAAIEAARPDIVLLPALGQSTIELTHAITRRFSGVRLVIVGMKEHPETVTEALEAGAMGYVAEEESVAELCETIRLVARGETRLTPRVAAHVVGRLSMLAAARRAREAAQRVKLTPREITILELVAGGLTNKEVAVTLHVEEQTVKNHMHNILRRLHLRRRHQAVQFAWEAGMLRPTGPLLPVEGLRPSPVATAGAGDVRPLPRPNGAAPHGRSSLRGIPLAS